MAIVFVSCTHIHTYIQAEAIAEQEDLLGIPTADGSARVKEVQKMLHPLASLWNDAKVHTL